MNLFRSHHERRGGEREIIQEQVTTESETSISWGHISKVSTNENVNPFGRKNGQTGFRGVPFTCGLIIVSAVL